MMELETLTCVEVAAAYVVLTESVRVVNAGCGMQRRNWTLHVAVSPSPRLLHVYGGGGGGGGGWECSRTCPPRKA